MENMGIYIYISNELKIEKVVERGGGDYGGRKFLSIKMLILDFIGNGGKGSIYTLLAVN